MVIMWSYVFFNSAFPSCVQLKKALEELSELLAEKEALAQRCQELDMQVNTELIHTNWSVTTEKYTLMNHLQLAPVPSVYIQSQRLHTHTRMLASGTV